MVLEQVEVVGLQALEALVDLLRGGGAGASVDLGHQEDAFPVTVAQRPAHAFLAFAVAVVPGVVHEVDAPVDGGADDAHALVLVGFADVRAADADERDGRARAAERTVDHVALAGLAGGGSVEQREVAPGGGVGGAGSCRGMGDGDTGGERGGGGLEEAAAVEVHIMINMEHRHAAGGRIGAYAPKRARNRSANSALFIRRSPTATSAS